MGNKSARGGERQSQRLWRSFIHVLSMASVLVLLAMMMLTSADVIARYVLNRPISGAFELTEIFLAALVFLAMPLTTVSDGHIRVDLLPVSQGSLTARLLTVLGVLFVAGIFAFMAWEVSEHAFKLHKRGTVTNSLSIPLYLVAILVAAACAVSAIAAIVAAVGGKRQ